MPGIAAPLFAFLLFASPPVYDCRFTDGPIVVDGKLDETAWHHATIADDFRRHWLGKEARPQAKTKARLLWDREFLYFAAQLDDDDLFSPLTLHDSKTWYNDVFEIFLKPAVEKPGYYEFHVTPRNTTMDLFIPDRAKWNFDEQVKKESFAWQSKTTFVGSLEPGDTDRQWIVEGRLPWKDFTPTGGRPEPNAQWTFALCRYNFKHKSDVPETSTTALLTKNDFHRYEDWSILRFVPPRESPGVPIRKAIEKSPRPSAWKTSKVRGDPDPPPPFMFRPVWKKLQADFPIVARFEPNSNELWFVVEPSPYAPSQLKRTLNGVDVGDTALLLDNSPGIVYDVCFHPRFAQNAFVYLGLNEPVGDKKELRTRIVRYTVERGVDRPGTAKLKPESRLVIIDWPSNGHNGGAAAFGTDGYLYVTSGDGTSESDLGLAGQDLSRLLAKVLRIDVDRPANGKAYSIPADNPFLGRPNVREETWAYGLRNPWRLTFDAPSGQLWTAQNGQDQYEQVYLIERGKNYGWSLMEGGRPFYSGRQAGPDKITPPTIDHPHSEARSLTGGVVYRGSRFPELAGMYLYGDYSTGRVWGVRYLDGRVAEHRELARTRMPITAFFVDRDGEVFLCNHQGGGAGGFAAMDRAPLRQPSDFPKRLSDTGLFASVADHRMAEGIVPYSINAAFWSDGAHKERWIAIPNGDRIGYADTRGWNFPEGTTIVKSFAFDRHSPSGQTKKQWHETRLLTKQEGEWQGYSYRWNEAGDDATLVAAEGLDAVVGHRDGGKNEANSARPVWRYPSRAECMMCHSRAANYVLGLCTIQMNAETQVGGETVNQLALFEAWKFFDLPGGSALLPRSPADLPRLVDPRDDRLNLEARARSYLHANCSSCHIKEGGGNSKIDLDRTTSTSAMNAVDLLPLHEKLDVPNPSLIASGRPECSVLLRRMATRGRGRMPPIASHAVDEKGTRLIEAWIRGLKTQPASTPTKTSAPAKTPADAPMGATSR